MRWWSWPRSGTARFAADPRVGPWVTVLRTDDAFAKAYAAADPAAYGRTVTAMGRLLFDRDTVLRAPSRRT